MLRLENDQEKVLFKLKKSVGPIIWMVIFFAIWLFVASILLAPAYQAVILRQAALTEESFQAGLVGLAVFLGLVPLIILSYALNDLVITDQRIYLRYGVFGRSVSIGHSDVRSFQHFYSGRQRSNNGVILYLLCGRQIKSGNLYITLGSLQSMLETLRGLYEGRGFTRQELKQLAAEHPGAGQPVVRTNIAAIGILLLPFLLAIGLTVFYLAG